MVKSYNIYAIDNLKKDLDCLEEYFRGLSNTHLGMGDCLIPLNNLIKIFTHKKFDMYLDKNRFIDNFFDIKNEDLIRFLSRYKNLKKSTEMKGKINENDISAFIKKLKEIK